MSVFLNSAQQSTQQHITVNSADFSCRQREMPMLQEIAPPVFVSEAELSLCETFTAALHLCIRLSRTKRLQGDLAGIAGINATQFSKILKGAKGQKWNLDPQKIEAIEQACGNRAMTQWLAARAGLRVIQETPEQRRIRELEEQVAQLRRDAA